MGCPIKIKLNSFQNVREIRFYKNLANFPQTLKFDLTE
jgi:hypothetical protein